jgi:hypothetical protein
VFVAEVLDGPAKSAGVKPGDIIIRFNGVVLKSAQQLSELVNRARLGINIQTVIYRNKRVEDIRIAMPGSATANAVVPRLGITIENLDEKKLDNLYLGPRNNYISKYCENVDLICGVIITSVDGQGIAKRSDIQVNDVIIKYCAADIHPNCYSGGDPAGTHIVEGVDGFLDAWGSDPGNPDSPAVSSLSRSKQVYYEPRVFILRDTQLKPLILQTHGEPEAKAAAAKPDLQMTYSFYLEMTACSDRFPKTFDQTKLALMNIIKDLEKSIPKEDADAIWNKQAEAFRNEEALFKSSNEYAANLKCQQINNFVVSNILAFSNQTQGAPLRKKDF